MNNQTIFKIVVVIILIIHVPIAHYINKRNKDMLAFFNYHMINLSVIVMFIRFLINNVISNFIYLPIFTTIMFIIYLINMLSHANKKTFFILSVYIVDSFILIISIYANLYNKYSTFFNKDNISRAEIVYYSITTFTTTGYGDIYPTHNITRLIASSEMIFGYLFSGVILALFVSKFIEVKTKQI